MKLKRRDFNFDIKAVDTKTGEFSGYGSVFDELDFYRDVIRPGAFTQTLAEWKTKGRLPPVLWQHRADSPVGPFTKMEEDDHGLYVEGRLLVDDVQQAREAHALMKAGAVSGLSIGFDMPEDGIDYDGKTNVWNITRLNLWECSVVTFPANESARVEAVKAALQSGKLPTLAEFEDLLRDAAGFSRKQARMIAGHGYKSLLRDAGELQRDAGQAEKAVDLSPILHYLKRA